MYKKLKFLSRRGMLELDLLLTKYIDNYYSAMSDELKQQYEHLMQLTDPELLDLLVNENNYIRQQYKHYQNIIDDIICKK